MKCSHIRLIQLNSGFFRLMSKLRVFRVDLLYCKNASVHIESRFKITAVYFRSIDERLL